MFSFLSEAPPREETASCRRAFIMQRLECVSRMCSAALKGHDVMNETSRESVGVKTKKSCVLFRGGEDFLYKYS